MKNKTPNTPDAPSGGSISTELKKGHHIDSDFIIKRTLQERKPMLLGIANFRIDRRNRRREDAEDAIQETCIALANTLKRTPWKFRNRLEIFRWCARVVDWKAIDAFNRACRGDVGASQAGPALDKNGVPRDPNDILIERQSLNPPPEMDETVKTEADRIQNDFDHLSELVLEEAKRLSDEERPIVGDWLGNQTFRDIALSREKTVWCVRVITFNFKENPVFKQLIIRIHHALQESKKMKTGVAARVDCKGAAARVIMDERKKP